MSGIIGQGQRSGVIGDLLPTNTWAYGEGVGTFGTSGNRFGFNGIHIGNNFTWSDSYTKATPKSPGYYKIDVAVGFWNEPPSGSELDSGTVRLYYDTTLLVNNNMIVDIEDTPSTSHEGVYSPMTYIHKVTGSPSFYSIEYTDFTSFGSMNEGVMMSIIKIK